MAEPGKYDRIFQILEYLARRPNGATLSVVAREIHIPLSSCHDILQRLEAISAVSLTEDKRYRLGSRSRALAASISEGEHLLPISRRHLAQLARELGFDVYLAVASYGTVTYVDRIRGTNPVNVNVPLGQTLAVHATAAGKLFAALDEQTASIVLTGSHALRNLTAHTITDRAALKTELEWIVEHDHSVSREEAILGVTGVAVPVRSNDGSLLAALHVSMLSAAWTPEIRDRVIGAMRSCARKIERDVA